MVGGSRPPAGAGQLGEEGSDIEARKQSEISGAAYRRIPCDQVISRVDRHADARQGHSVARFADLSAVAKELGTNVTWVERCMLAYGRRVRRPGIESAGTTERRLESFEEDEVEEVQPEDVEGGGGEFPERPERQRRLKSAPVPTPTIPLD
jgi:hypothetical protein